MLGAVVFRYVLNKGTPALNPRPVAPAGTLAADEFRTQAATWLGRELHGIFDVTAFTVMTRR